MRIKHFIITLITLFSVNAYGQTQGIGGKWKLDWSKVVDGMSASEKTRFDAIPEPSRARISSSMASRVFDFKQDGTLIVTWQSNNGSKLENGRWNISDNTLTMNVNGLSKEYKVLRQSELLSLSMSAEGGAIMSTLVLIKQD